jgi:vacuolar-type H+-ATPase subunit E/Vma4
MTTNQNSAENLSAEILAEARRKAKEIVSRAHKDAEVLLTGAAAESDQVRQKLLEQARTEADRLSSLILATVPIETGRQLLARVEAQLESIHDEACQRLLAREGFEYRATVIALASEAICQMVGVEFVVRLSGTDQTIVDDGLAEAIAHRAGRSVSITISREEDITGDGVIIEDAEARQVWDNRLLKKLERLWPELRRQIAMQSALVPQGRATGDDP